VINLLEVLCNYYFHIVDIVFGLAVNAEKTKYMFVSRKQNAGQYHNIKMGNK
jgi:hypothetical protein